MNRKDIPGHKGYSIAENGEVEKTVDVPHHGVDFVDVKPFKRTGSGDRLFVLLDKKQHPVDRLVANAFLGKPKDDTMQPFHLDGNEENNHYENLVWLTRKNYLKLMKTIGLLRDVRGLSHHRKGKLHSSQSRKRMASRKIGSKNPMHAGTWIVNGKRYASSEAAATENKVSASTIRYRCLNNLNGHSFQPKKRSNDTDAD